MLQLSEVDVLLLASRRIVLFSPIQVRNLFQFFFGHIGRNNLLPFPKKVGPRTLITFHTQRQNLDVDVDCGLLIWGVCWGGFLCENRLLIKIAQGVLLSAQLH